MARLPDPAFALASAFSRAVVVALLVTCAAIASAQTVTQGAGPSATGARDVFRLTLGGGTTPGANGSFGGVRREINWDGVPASFAAPNNLPPNFFNVNSPRGVVFGGPQFQVSGATTDSGLGQPVLPNFGNINPSYTITFAPFSAQRLFTSLGINIFDVTFFVPGTSRRAVTRGVGAMFSDADNAAITSMQLFDAADNSLGTFPVLPAPGDFSFLGISFAAATVSRVRIVAGNAPLGPTFNDNPPGIDVVAMDDFLYGEPLALCTLTCPANMTVANDANDCGAVVDYPAVSSSGLCGTVTSTPPSGSFFPVGTTTVTAVAPDSTSCTFTVTVFDVQQPAISCPADITKSATSADGAVVDFATPGASDNCTGQPTVSCDPVSGSTFPVGTTLVTCTATDEASNFSNCSFHINVKPLPPSITKSFAGANVSINTPVPLSFTLTNPNLATGLTSIAFSDALPDGMSPLSGPASACGGDVTIDPNLRTIALTGGALAANDFCTFSVDVQSTTGGPKHNVTSNVTAAESGDGEKATADITVLDTCTITCPANITVSNDVDACGAVVTYSAPTVEGPCGTVTATPASGSLFPVGTTLVTVQEENGASCSFNVTVNDTQPPKLTCPGDITTPSTSPAGAVVTFDPPEAIDTCPGVTASCDATSGSTFPIGTTVVTCTGKDAVLNTTTCTFKIRVTAEPPTISKSFGAATVALNATVSLSFTIHNPNAQGTLSGIAFTDQLPDGMTVESAPATACGGTVTADPKSGRPIALDGATLSGGDTCTFSVDVSAFSPGVKHNTTSSITSSESGSGDPASADITVIESPSFSKAFDVPSIPTLGPEMTINTSRALRFRIANINPAFNLTNISFVDSLPAGLIVSDPSTIIGSCGSGTITAVAGSSTISLSGATLGADSSCTFWVYVTATNLGILTNTTVISTAETGAGPSATASVRVLAAGPATVTATAQSGTSIRVDWSAVTGAQSYAVGRSAPDDFKHIAFLGFNTGTTYTDNTAEAGYSYFYVVAWAPSPASPPIQYSAPTGDVATTIFFSDPTLTNTTPIKATHFNEALTAINAVRTLAILEPFSFGETLTAGATLVRASHLVGARNAIAEALAVLGLPPPAYTQTVLTPGVTKPRAADVTELRGTTQ